jgi:hypothetical protein
MIKYVLKKYMFSDGMYFESNEVGDDSLDELKQQDANAKEVQEDDINSIVDLIQKKLDKYCDKSEELIFDFRGFILSQANMLQIVEELKEYRLIQKVIFSQESLSLLEKDFQGNFATRLNSPLAKARVKASVSTVTDESKSSEIADDNNSIKGSDSNTSGGGDSDIVIFAERVSLASKMVNVGRRASEWIRTPSPLGKDGSGRNSDVSNVTGNIKNSLTRLFGNVSDDRVNGSENGSNERERAASGDSIFSESGNRTNAQQTTNQQSAGESAEDIFQVLRETDVGDNASNADSEEEHHSSSSASGENIDENEKNRLSIVTINDSKVEFGILADAYDATYKTSTHWFKSASFLHNRDVKNVNDDPDKAVEAFQSHITSKSDSRSARVFEFVKEYKAGNESNLQAQIRAYKAIYAAIHALHGYNSSFLKKLEQIETKDGIEEYCAIREHAEQDTHSWTKIAWNEAATFVEKTKNNQHLVDSIAREKLVLIQQLRPKLIEKIKINYYNTKGNDSKIYAELLFSEQLEEVKKVIASTAKIEHSFFRSKPFFSEKDKVVAAIATVDLFGTEQPAIRNEKS